MSVLLRVENLVKYYGNRSSLTKALNDISLNVEKGGIYGNYGGFRFRKNYASELYLHH